MSNKQNIKLRGSFKKNGKTFLLNHLNPKIFSIDVEGVQGLNRKKIRIHISYSSHCFTSKFNPNKHEKTDRYYQCPEGRFFCLERYELSKSELIPMIKSFSENSYRNFIYEGERSDYFKIKLVNGEEYVVYFRLEKNKLKNKIDKNDLLMIITSAHINKYERLNKRKNIKNKKSFQKLSVEKLRGNKK